MSVNEYGNESDNSTQPPPPNSSSSKASSNTDLQSDPSDYLWDAKHHDFAGKSAHMLAELHLVDNLFGTSYPSATVSNPLPVDTCAVPTHTHVRVGNHHLPKDPARLITTRLKQAHRKHREEELCHHQQQGFHIYNTIMASTIIFAIHTQLAPEDVLKRGLLYEEVSTDLRAPILCLTTWRHGSHALVLEKECLFRAQVLVYETLYVDNERRSLAVEPVLRT